MRWTPHDYQQATVGRMLRATVFGDQLGHAVFADPGLGKTAMSLSYLEKIRDMGVMDRALIIAPLRVVYSVWPVEICKWGANLTWSVIHGPPSKRTRMLREQSDLHLINPEGVPWLRQTGAQYDTLIVDESTRFKNWSARCTKALRKMLPMFERRILLSGTPGANSLVDLFSQIFLIDDGASLGTTIGRFRQKYCYRGGFEDREWIFKDHMTSELTRSIRHLTTRLEAEDWLDLPDLLYNPIPIHLPQDVLGMYKDLETEWCIELGQDDVVISNNKFTSCRGMANGGVYRQLEDGGRETLHFHDAKTEAVRDLVDELAGKPVIVVYQFNHDLERMRKVFPKAPAIRGGISDREAGEIINDWNGGNIPVLLIQPQSASHGLNLQAGGNDMIFYGLPIMLEVFQQMVRRIYRQGVSGAVRIHLLLANQTVDWQIWRSLQKKDATEKSVLRELKQYARSKQ